MTHAAPAPRQDTARDLLIADIPVAPASSTVQQQLDTLRSRRFAFAELICVVDASGRLCGAVPIVDLVAAAPERTLASLVRTPPVAVGSGTDQERIASLALRHGLTAVPVVDGDGRPRGAVPATTLLHVLRHEHVEDLHRLAGIHHGAALTHDPLEAPVVQRTVDRLPWLLVGLLGSMVAAFVMSRFERALEAQMSLAFFVPAIVYLADAIGTQTESMVVRGLSVSHAPLRQVLPGELKTGVLIGGILGALAFGIVTWVTDLRVGIAVGTAVLGAGTLATGIGLLLPWLLYRSGKDPALGSGPLATIIQDVLSLLLYFAIASLVMPR
jgi:magnesium transporter